MKHPFGFMAVRMYEKDGVVHFAWRLRWWYAVWLVLKMTYSVLTDKETYAEHTDEEVFADEETEANTQKETHEK